jgi:two-component system alkaline phosphatase synthesis response regulator PhoP
VTPNKHAIKNILIVEDDDAIATGLALNLKLAGYAAHVVQDGDVALRMVAEERFDLILMDINLPKKDGFTLTSELRDNGNHTPIIMVSARSDEYDKVAALRLGADDYVTKPFSLAELIARVDAVLRRTSAPSTTDPSSAQDGLGFANVAIDPGTRTVTQDDLEVKLTRLQFELMLFLVRNPSQVFSRDQLLLKVWGQKSGSPRTIDNFVAQLRSKLESDPENPRHFITVRGSGYRFDP